MNNFINLINHVIELTEIDPELEYIQNPTPYAVIRTIEYLTGLYNELRIDFPRGWSNLESRGGVALTWDDIEFNKKVWITIPYSLSKETNVYYRVSEDYELIYSPSIKFLAQLLRWFSTDEPLLKGESQPFSLYTMKDDIKDDFTITLKRLLELTEIDPDIQGEELEYIQNPTFDAVIRSIKYLTDIYELLGDLFPRGWSSLENRGGVNLIWSNERTNKTIEIEIRVRVRFSPELEDSVYYSISDGNGDNYKSELVINPSMEFIHRLFLWLSDGSELLIGIE